MGAPGADATDDPERLVGIVARVVARTGDRFSAIRKLSRHFEGKDKRSGLLSDVTAAVMELYRRNPDTFHSLGKQAVQDFNARRTARGENQQSTGGMNNATG